MAYNKCIFSGAIKTKLKPKSTRKTVYAQFPLASASLGRQPPMGCSLCRRWEHPSAFSSPQPSISHSPLAGLQEQVHSTKGSWRLLKMTKAGLAHLLLWAGQFTTDSILLQEFFFYVQNYCKTILCWISIWTYFIGLVKLLGRSWFPELFPLPTPGTTPQGEVALGMGQSEHQNITCPQSHPHWAQIKPSQNHCQRNSHRFWEGENKAQVHLLKK